MHQPSTRHRFGAFAAAAALVAAMSPAVAAMPVAAPVVDGPELGPLVAGTSSYVDGTLVWTDYVLDDRGANTEEPGGERCTTPGQATCSGGDATYPPGAAPGNAADLVQLQVSRSDGGDVHVRAVLGTLVDPDVATLVVAFDTDADPATGAGSLPEPAWGAVTGLGVERLVVASAEGAAVFSFSAGRWSAGYDWKATADTVANTIDVTVPVALLPPTTGQWRVFAGTAVGDTPYDLAFVGDEPMVRWQENRQADVLAGRLASTNAAATLDFAKVDAGVTELVDEWAPGWKTFLHRSALNLPEGVEVNPEDDTEHTYLGPFQPYMVHVPEEPPPGNPLTVYLHGANQNHLQSVFVTGLGYAGTARQQSEDLHLIPIYQADAALDTSAPVTLQVFPLGRGETLGYQGISEVDVFEVLADASRRFGVDPDRVTLQGSSMGGVGAYRLGVLHPDRWAAILPHIGTGIASRDLFGNLRNVPVRQINGARDDGELGPPSEADAELLDALGYDHHYWLVTDRAHELAPYYRCVFASVPLGSRRVTHPHRVTYTVDPARFRVDPAIGLDLRYDSAYWVSGLRVREEDGRGTVDAVSDAVPHRELTAVRAHLTRDNRTSGQDLCGPDPAYAPGWTPAHPAGESWRERSLALVPGDELPTADRLHVTLTNLAAASFDLAGAGIEAGGKSTLHVRSDGESAVTLTGLQPGTKVAVGERVADVAGAGGEATVTVPEGSSVVRTWKRWGVRR